MFSSYTGTLRRSKSATNIAADSDTRRDDLAPSSCIGYSSTLSRSRNHQQSRGNKRASAAAATPVAAPRTHRRYESYGQAPDAATVSPRCPRSYLNYGIRRQLELGLGSSINGGGASSPSSAVAKGSPRSSNFVKRLVASLERRQREIIDPETAAAVEAATTSACHRRAADEFAVKPGGSSTWSWSSTSSSSSSSKDSAFFEGTTNNGVIRRINGDVFETFKSEQTLRRRPLSELEDVYEGENEDDYDDFSVCEKFQSNYRWHNEKIVPPLPARNFFTPGNAKDGRIRSFANISNSSNNNNNNDEKRKNNNAPPEKPSVRRSLKNMFSSLIGWRGGAAAAKGGLPKGSRDIGYATRESLGEEMRAFRRDTMPQLMRQAAIHDAASPAGRAAREFSRIIGCDAAAGVIRDEEVPRPQSIATIHPVYGCKSTSSALHRLSRCYEQQQQQQQQQAFGCQDRPEFNSEHVKNFIEPPTVPTGRDLSPTAEHLLRPSKVKNLQKRLSREIDAKVITSQLHQYPIDDTSDVIYDVPRSNRPVSVEVTPDQYQIEEIRYSPPKYANVHHGTFNDDTRLQRTAFTTF